MHEMCTISRKSLFHLMAVAIYVCISFSTHIENEATETIPEDGIQENVQNWRN